ncbi:putative potassium channel regulatory protein isoform X2 [Conger conger]|uniref:putative potassium channel regulatory protein isoform X2 n=1 Tax=Conger conger TaxID=82655 RepID=UPI002A5A510B|nr:putative potassium channel regulatory protein isoform X2 [Conger conger]
MSTQDILTINVGGQKFTTRTATLKKHLDSRLARMLDGSDSEFPVSGGQVFVDRDGTLFKYILDYIRTDQVSLPPNFSDFDGLKREAEFYEMHALAEFLGRGGCRPTSEILELRFSVQEMHGFFRLFCSRSSTLETLATRISVYAEQPAINWNCPHQHQKPMIPVPLQRPSHHDVVFQCGTDYSAGDEVAASRAQRGTADG